MKKNDDSDQAVFNTILNRNIETLLIRRKEEEQRRSSTDKIATSITRFAGSMVFVSKISEKLRIDVSQNPELKHLAKDVKPEKVMDTIEDTEKKILENKFPGDEK